MEKSKLKLLLLQPALIPRELNNLDTKIDEVKQELVEKIDTIELEKGDNGDIGEKGDKGNSGEPGIDGRDGINGINGKDGKNGIDGVDGVDGLDGLDGRPGLNASPDSPDDIADKLNTLEDAIESKVVKGLLKIEDVVNELKNPKSKNRLELRDIKGARLDMGDMRWHGGGVSDYNKLKNRPELLNKVMTYNGSGQLIKLDTSDGVSTVYSYNVNGQLISKNNGTNNWTYTYNISGQLTNVDVT